jgi:sterol desaturase/sphingolipid hydroxylase (fatty acid hydroxylase superfamily)
LSRSRSSSMMMELIVVWCCSVLVWPAMILLPLLLTMSVSPFHYSKIFPIEWYSTANDTADNIDDVRRKPLGLVLGILSVAIGQVGVWIFFYLYKYGYIASSNVSHPTTTRSYTTSSSNNTNNYNTKNASSKPYNEPTSIQTKGSVQYDYLEGVLTHISQPEGFVVLTAYLAITWMFNLLPNSYYQFTNTSDASNTQYGGSIQYKELFLCLVIQDAIQYVMHRLEHDLSPTFYQKSHKPHHKFLNPRLFDAFNGSLTDTICMIIIPLYITTNLVRTTNVWTYMAFGSTYACWLTLIHSEYVFVWDPYFRFIGFGTPADHHVHHAFFKYNYGHLFMWFDQIAGTYHNPNMYIPKYFNVGV